jgi:hypothetical protein
MVPRHSDAEPGFSLYWRRDPAFATICCPVPGTDDQRREPDRIAIALIVKCMKNHQGFRDLPRRCTITGKDPDVPAKSKKQQQFMGIELDKKRHGKPTKTDMTEQQLVDFAATPTKKLPTRVKKEK